MVLNKFELDADETYCDKAGGRCGDEVADVDP